MLVELLVGDTSLYRHLEATGVDLQVVLIAKPLTEVLRLLAVHIAQTDFRKLPISK
jgi:hypothetical protein